MSFLVNDYFLPLGIIKYNQLYRQVITSNPTVELEPHSIKRTNNSILVIGDVDKKHVSDLVFFDTTNNGNQRLIIAKDTNVYNAKQPGVIMGIGTPEYILEAVADGVDMFDCVLPTRNGRNGSYFTHHGMLSIKQERFMHDQSPIDAECHCKVCQTYSRSYLRHLFKEQEILSAMLASYHNLYFLHNMESVSTAPTIPS